MESFLTLLCPTQAYPCFKDIFLHIWWLYIYTHAFLITYPFVSKKILLILVPTRNEKLYYNQSLYIPYLTNLEDEISVRGGRICNALKYYFDNLDEY